MIFSDKYKPLWTEKYRYAIVSGGRGSAKSFTVQTFLGNLTYQAGHKIALTRYTMNSAEKSVIPEFEEKLILQNIQPDFQLTGRTYHNKKSGSDLYFMGLKTSSGVQTASLKSINGLTTWSMEEAEELIDDGNEVEACTFDKIDDSIRKKGIDLRTILTWNPSSEDSFIYERFFKSRGVDITFNGLLDDTLYIYTTYEDNLKNLHPSFVKKARDVQKTNPPRYDHIYLGKPIAENPFALWRMKTMIAPFRVEDVPELKRIYVAVDPSVSDTGHQDECGLVAVGEDFKGHFYVMKDESDMMSPREWGRATAGLYHDLNADRIIAEQNQGGQLVKDNIRLSGGNLPVELVHATKGKIVRCEPIAALYEEGRVHHVGHFKELEAEMVSYTGKKGEKSPNRLDALVWGLTALSGEAGPQISIDFI